MRVIKRLAIKSHSTVAPLLDVKTIKLNKVQSGIYKKNDELFRQLSPGKQKSAVVLHLYYTESWRTISKHLKNLPKQSFDLFVSLSTSDMTFSKNVIADYPSTYIYEVPNRGRDVLPFLYVAHYLQKAGYEYLLKIHSKKSIHRTDGKEWLEDMLESLMPTTNLNYVELLRALEDSKTGIVGPAGQYLNLGVNFEANGHHMTSILNRVYANKTSYDVLQTNRCEYGFFAGTMFWTRLDALSPIINQRFGISKFEKEQGQIDATFAHAMERVFCLVPEIEKRQMYEIGPGGIKKIANKTTNIPDWSDVYIGPEEVN